MTIHDIKLGCVDYKNLENQEHSLNEDSLLRVQTCSLDISQVPQTMSMGETHLENDRILSFYQ